MRPETKAFSASGRNAQNEPPCQPGHGQGTPHGRNHGRSPIPFAAKRPYGVGNARAQRTDRRQNSHTARRPGWPWNGTGLERPPSPGAAGVQKPSAGRPPPAGRDERGGKDGIETKYHEPDDVAEATEKRTGQTAEGKGQEQRKASPAWADRGFPSRLRHRKRWGFYCR